MKLINEIKKEIVGIPLSSSKFNSLKKSFEELYEAVNGQSAGLVNAREVFCIISDVYDIAKYSIEVEPIEIMRELIESVIHKNYFLSIEGMDDINDDLFMLAVKQRVEGAKVKSIGRVFSISFGIDRVLMKEIIELSPLHKEGRNPKLGIYDISTEKIKIVESFDKEVIVKTGVDVQLRNVSLYYVKGGLLISYGNVIPLKEYNEDLTHKTNPDLDIVRIYNSNSNVIFGRED